MGINKRTLRLSRSQLIDLISETVILMEQDKQQTVDLQYGDCGDPYRNDWEQDLRNVSDEWWICTYGCDKEFTYTQDGTGFVVADAGDIQDFLNTAGHFRIVGGFAKMVGMRKYVKKDWKFGDETAKRVARFLGYPNITTRVGLIQYMWPLYPKEFGTPSDPNPEKTFGLGPRAQGVIAGLLVKRCKELIRDAVIPEKVQQYVPGLRVHLYHKHRRHFDDYVEERELEKYLADPDFSGDCDNPLGGGMGQGGGDAETQARAFLEFILYNLNQRSGWGSSSAPGNMGRCTGEYGLFGTGYVYSEKITTLKGALESGWYCIPKYGFHNISDFVSEKYNGDWVKALHTEVGTLDMCEIEDLLEGNVSFDWDNSGLKGLVNACKRNAWQCLEYTADAISFIAMWFGPVGWVVSTISGFVSIYAMIKQEKYGWALVAGAFECFGILMVIKHLKTVSKIAGYSDDTIESGIKYFDNPTADKFDALSPNAKNVVEEMRSSNHVIKDIVANTSNHETRKVILAVKSEKEFKSLVKLGKVEGLDDLGWKEFQHMQKSITNSDLVLDGIYNVVKQGIKFSVVLGSGYLISKVLADKANSAIFKAIINNTDDIISEEKVRIQRAAPYTGTIKYNVKAILAQDPPFDKQGVTQVHNVGDDNAIPDSNSQQTAHDYTEALQLGAEVYASSTGLLLLTKIWRDKTKYPPITPSATTCVYRSPSTDIELDEVVNPGGGWRPNLNCLTDYHISEVEAQAENTTFIKSIETLLHDYKEAEITETKLKREVGTLMNMSEVEYTKIDFSVIDTADYVIY